MLWCSKFLVKVFGAEFPMSKLTPFEKDFSENRVALNPLVHQLVFPIEFEHIESGSISKLWGLGIFKAQLQWGRGPRIWSAQLGDAKFDPKMWLSPSILGIPTHNQWWSKEMWNMVIWQQQDDINVIGVPLSHLCYFSIFHEIN